MTHERKLAPLKLSLAECSTATQLCDRQTICRRRSTPELRKVKLKGQAGRARLTKLGLTKVGRMLSKMHCLNSLFCPNNINNLLALPQPSTQRRPSTLRCAILSVRTTSQQPGSRDRNSGSARCESDCGTTAASMHALLGAVHCGARHHNLSCLKLLAHLPLGPPFLSLCRKRLFRSFKPSRPQAVEDPGPQTVLRPLEAGDYAKGGCMATAAVPELHIDEDQPWLMVDRWEVQGT